MELECKSLRLAPCAPAKQAADKEHQGSAGCVVFLRLLVSEHVLVEWSAIDLMGGPPPADLAQCLCRVADVSICRWQPILHGS